MPRKGVSLLAIDVGTTHCKAGLFRPDGSLAALASREMKTRCAPKGYAYFDPAELWVTVVATLAEVLEIGMPRHLAAVGIASMAETGLLLDRESGAGRSPMIPWFDPVPTPQAELLKQAGEPQQRFCRSGIRPNFKCSLAKILWLLDQDNTIVQDAVWLSAADYIAYCLTDRIATDYTLAGRTYAFRLDQKQWDTDWLRSLGIDPGLFPDPLPSGSPVGGVSTAAAQATGLAAGTPVAICGHDHVCAAFAAGVITPGVVFDSLGTAEALVGAFEERALGEQEYRSGLAYGCHVAKGLNYWMGGLSAAGGSVEWLRSILGDPPLSYENLEGMLEQASPDPTGIMYFPYLSGSGSPHTDLLVRGAYVGLDAAHRRADLVKSVLEGTAYEVEFIQRRAEQVLGYPIHRMAVSGGGTRNPHWMQIKADVSGCRLEAPAMPEATLLGAALVAGVGVGIYRDAAEALVSGVQPAVEIYLPETGRHKTYQQIYERGYLFLQSPLRELAERLSG